MKVYYDPMDVCSDDAYCAVCGCFIAYEDQYEVGHKIVCEDCMIDEPEQ